MPEASPEHKPSPEGGQLLVETPIATAGAAIAGATELEGAVLKRRWGIGFWLAAGWVALVVVLAVTAYWLPFVRDPLEIDPPYARHSFSAHNWLGADNLGRDLFARSVHGARISLFIGVVAIVMGLAIGGTLGLIAGYYRGRLETLIMSLADVMLAFPALILALAIVSFRGRSITNVTIALAVLAVPSLTRITRANTLVFAQREFVLAARALGARNRRVIVGEILPNVALPMASFALVAIAVVIVAEGALSFLGLGVPAPQPTWGGMINEGRESLEFAPHIALVPSGVMFLTILSFNYIGDKVRARFDVRQGAL